MSAKPLERQTVIEAIEQAGKTAEFVKGYGRTPAAYFEEYSYLEPKIWRSVLEDLGIVMHRGRLM